MACFAVCQAIKHVASIRAIALRANLSTAAWPEVISASARARGDCKGTCLACLAAELQAKDPLSALELALLVDGAAKWNATLKAVFLTHLVGMIRNVAGTKLQQEVTATRTRRSSPSTFRVVSRRSLPLPAGVEQD